MIIERKTGKSRGRGGDKNDLNSKSSARSILSA